MAAECDFMLRAVSPRHQLRQYEVRNADHDQRCDGDPRVGQLLLLEWHRLVEKLRAIAFPAFLCRSSAVLDIGKTDAKNENATDEPQHRGGPRRRIEER